MLKRVVSLILMVSLLSACTGRIPRDALQLNPESLADRQMQTRRFQTTNYEAMLGSASAVFQDLGFTLEEAEFNLGVLTGSKSRDAVSAGQIVGAVLVAALTGVATHVDRDQVIRVSMVMREVKPADAGKAAKHRLTPEALRTIQQDVTTGVAVGLRKHFPHEVSEKIARKIASHTADTLTKDLSKLMRNSDEGESVVRVTFQRVIYDTAGQVTRREQINDQVLYQEFFDKLSQAVFLEAHEI